MSMVCVIAKKGLQFAQFIMGNFKRTFVEAGVLRREVFFGGVDEHFEHLK